jgi:hypothetical protein
MLIDWLAVIGLTVLLASLVFPAIPRVRREVILIACQQPKNDER